MENALAGWTIVHRSKSVPPRCNSGSCLSTSKGASSVGVGSSRHTVNKKWLNHNLLAVPSRATTAAGILASAVSFAETARTGAATAGEVLKLMVVLLLLSLLLVSPLQLLLSLSLQDQLLLTTAAAPFRLLMGKNVRSLVMINTFLPPTAVTSTDVSIATVLLCLSHVQEPPAQRWRHARPPRHTHVYTDMTANMHVFINLSAHTHTYKQIDRQTATKRDEWLPLDNSSPPKTPDKSQPSRLTPHTLAYDGYH